MTDREIMQQALNALEYHTKHTYSFHQTNVAMEALQKALAQPEPFKPDWVSYRQGVADGAAQHEQESPHSAKHSADSAEGFGKPDIGLPDPCPQCRKGGVCRTPKCGRLQLPAEHPYRNQAFAQFKQGHLSDAMSVLADVNADLIAEAKLVQTEQEHIENEILKRCLFQMQEAAKELASNGIDRRLKVKLGRQYGYDLNGHWFYLQPADEYADQALTKHSGITAPMREWFDLTTEQFKKLLKLTAEEIDKNKLTEVEGIWLFGMIVQAKLREKNG